MREGRNVVGRKGGTRSSAGRSLYKFYVIIHKEQHNSAQYLVPESGDITRDSWNV